ncbi:hypothetical protein STEG23_004937 [Scotinomys teguina]
MNLLAENGRLTNTQGVISAFSTIMSVHHGEVPCTVTTASPLDEAVLSELKTVLQSFLSQGQILKLEVKPYPSIMGGMIVRIGEKYVDMSATTKIQKLGKAIRTYSEGCVTCGSSHSWCNNKTLPEQKKKKKERKEKQKK